MPIRPCENVDIPTDEAEQDRPYREFRDEAEPRTTDTRLRDRNHGKIVPEMGSGEQGELKLIVEGGEGGDGTWETGTDECFEVIIYRNDEILKPGTHFRDGPTNGGNVLGNESHHKIVGMDRFDFVHHQYVNGKILGVEGYDHVRLRMDRSR